ncbi:kinase-like domain-containing protein [Rhizophagus clarus]|uniref:Kinase-like domain-containing protein n=1 Tax=Rhizophagus clarus TaxID=94130 RepID=A0A8H3LRY0_9GLOM|nr:kinase-like domain-containing protein [Rhizophagus clarus]
MLLRFEKSENTALNKLIFENHLRWIPYNEFKDVEYLDKGGFSTIYKAIWIDKNQDKKVVLKCFNNLDENLEEFLNEWKRHESCLDLSGIIYLYGFTKKQDTCNYMAVMDHANSGNLRRNLTDVIKNNWNQKLYLMTKCWSEDPLKRPSALEVKSIIHKWIYLPYYMLNAKISEELKSNIMEFINAPIVHKNLATESHPQACYTSRILDFTSEKVNEILVSECLGCIVKSLSDQHHKTTNDENN